MRRRDGVGLLLILGLGLLLRLWGNGWGLPFTYHPDEHQYIDSAVSMLAGDLNPHRFNNPSLLKYVNLTWIAGLFGLGRLAGVWGSVAEFQTWFAEDPSLVYRLARGMTAAMGAATAGIVWAIGRRAYDRTTGLIGAAFLAFAFLHVRDSHYGVSDIPAALMVALGLLLALQLLEHGRPRDLVLGGLLTGFAVATKYSALLVAVPLALAWLLHDDGAGTARWRRLFHRGVLFAAIAGVVAFLVAVPYSILDRPAFIEDLTTLAERGRTGFKGLALDDDPGWIFYLETLRWGLGLPMLGLAIGGVALALVERRKAGWVVVCFPLLMWLYLGGQLLMFSRFLIPALPAIAVLGAHATVRLAHLAARLAARPGLAPWIAAVLAAVAIAPSFAASVRHDVLLTRTDTRTLAKRWIESNIPEGTRVLYQSNGPELAGGERTAPLSRREYELERLGTLDLPERPLADYRADGWAILVTSTFSTERRLLDSDEDARYRAYYRRLAERVPRITSFRPEAGDADRRPPFIFAHVYGPATGLWRLERPGPAIHVYDLAGWDPATDLGGDSAP